MIDGKHKKGRACRTLLYLDHSYTSDLKASQTSSNSALFRHKLHWRDQCVRTIRIVL